MRVEIFFRVIQADYGLHLFEHEKHMIALFAKSFVQEKKKGDRHKSRNINLAVLLGLSRAGKRESR